MLVMTSNRSRRKKASCFTCPKQALMWLSLETKSYRPRVSHSVNPLSKPTSIDNWCFFRKVDSSPPVLTKSVVIMGYDGVSMRRELSQILPLEDRWLPCLDMIERDPMERWQNTSNVSIATFAPLSYETSTAEFSINLAKYLDEEMLLAAVLSFLLFPLHSPIPPMVAVRLSTYLPQPLPSH